jgi:tetratricopeptide (TPR) repeat protein
MIVMGRQSGDRDGGIGVASGGSLGLRRAGLVLLSLVVAILGSGLVPSSAAFAAEKDEKVDERTEADFQFSERTQKKIAKVVELFEAEDYEGAKKILLAINPKREKPYGRAMIYYFLGSASVAQDQHEEALGYFDKVVAENGLKPEEHLRAMFTRGQLQMMMERYDDAIASIEAWLKIAPKPPASAYYTLAAAYYQAQRSKEAIAPAKKAVELATEPQENWYRLLLSLYLDAERYEEAVELLDDIILAFPSKTYWTQLAAVYNQMEKTDKSLAVQQLAKYEGFITEEKDLTRLAQMLMVQGLPHRGAEVMKQGLADGSIKPSKLAYQTYSDTLLQSREWALALEPLAKAADLAEDGSLWVRHAQVHLQLGQWSDARDSLNRAFQKGKISDEGQAHVLYGIAAANDKQWDLAQKSFERAGRFPGTVDVSVKWLGYVERERLRFASPEEQAKAAAAAKAKAEAEAAAGGGDKKEGDGKSTQAAAGKASAASSADAKAAATAKN